MNTLYIVRVLFESVEVDWYCTRSKKQGHRIQLDSPANKFLLKLDTEIEAHEWFQCLSKTATNYQSWRLNNPIVSPSSESKTSSHFADSSEDLVKHSESPKLEKKNTKLGRKGYNKRKFSKNHF